MINNKRFRISEMKNFNKIVDVILLLPAVAWFLNGMINLLINGLYSYTYLIPFPVKIHTFSLLPITTFYIATFLIVKPHKPVKNFVISSTLLFLSNAIYELVYAIFISPHASPRSPFSRITLILPNLVLVLVGILLLFFLDRRFHFLTKDRNKIFLFLLCFLSFIVVMFILDYTGFFAQAYLWLKEQTSNDPHNPLWILSKILCIWMFFPLLDYYSKPPGKRKRAIIS